jgi:hypothetical protein
MSDDYLWDRTGPPDNQVQKLEELLAPLGHVPSKELPMPRRVLNFPVWPAARAVLRYAAVAAMLVLVAGSVVVHLWTREWSVTRLDGTPRVESQSVMDSASLLVGGSLETDASARARVRVGLIGYVDVEPNSRLRLLAAQVADHRLALERGRIRARIWAPPKLFYVQTPSALAVDLGCIYTLEVDDLGVGALRVQRGWVAFEHEGRESFVPEGAMCVTRPGFGPGTPVYESAPQELQNALKQVDFEMRGPAGGVRGGMVGDIEGSVPGSKSGGVPGGVAGGAEDMKRRRAEALNIVLTRARKQDALTLWHLLARTTADEQLLVFDRLAALVPPPEGVTREGILAGDREMRDRWWNALDLRSTSWWRFWKGPVPAPAD